MLRTLSRYAGSFRRAKFRKLRKLYVDRTNTLWVGTTEEVLTVMRLVRIHLYITVLHSAMDLITMMY